MRCFEDNLLTDETFCLLTIVDFSQQQQKQNRDVLVPPFSNADVTYWLNYHGMKENRSHKLAAINTAVEATTLNQRTYRLRAQDRFLRDRIQTNDVLIVSIGGNDVALLPTPCTILSLLCLPNCLLDYSSVCGSVPVSTDQR